MTKTSRSVAIERKAVSDLLSSIRDRQKNGKTRAVNQFERLRQADFPVLLIEGAMTPAVDGKVLADGRKTKWTWEAVDNFLLTVQQAGILVARCRKGDLARRLASLQVYFDKPAHLLPLAPRYRNGLPLEAERGKVSA